MANTSRHRTGSLRLPPLVSGTWAGATDEARLLLEDMQAERTLYGSTTPAYAVDMSATEKSEAEDTRVSRVRQSLALIPPQEHQRFAPLLARRDGVSQSRKPRARNTAEHAGSRPSRASPGSGDAHRLPTAESKKVPMHPRKHARTEEGKLDRANRMLDRYERFGVEHGLEDSVRYLRHFREGSGKDIVISPEEARMRNPVIEGEDINRERFEEALTRDRINPPPLEDKAEDYEYRSHLLNMKDGETIMVPKGGKDVFNYDRQKVGNLARGEIDELFATGSSKLVSEAKHGFRATRHGDKISLEGIVTHSWNDDYDFHGGPFSRDAEVARDLGGAKEFNVKSSWPQRMKAELEIDGGELILKSVEWQDIPLPPEKEH